MSTRCAQHPASAAHVSNEQADLQLVACCEQRATANVGTTHDPLSASRPCLVGASNGQQPFQLSHPCLLQSNALF